jgi:hypothetical protein
VSFHGKSGALAGLVIIAAVAVWWSGAGAPDGDQLARRCAECVPHWSNYDEALKASLGAKPFATWGGEPITAQWRDHDFLVVMKLTEPWSGYPFGLPLLLRDHLGHVVPGRPEAGAGEEPTYVFPLGGEGVHSAPPWVTLRFPRGEMRLTLDAEGRWP